MAIMGLDPKNPPNQYLEPPPKKPHHSTNHHECSAQHLGDFHLISDISGIFTQFTIQFFGVNLNMSILLKALGFLKKNCGHPLVLFSNFPSRLTVGWKPSTSSAK